MLDPRVLAMHIRQVDRRHLRRLVRGLPVGEEGDLCDAFVWFATSGRGRYRSWQHAWNAWVAHGRGTVTYRVRRCAECQGRRWSARSAATGSAVCRSCHGNGTGGTARRAAAPVADPEAPAGG